MLQPGETAPDFRLKTTEGGTESLMTILRHGPAVVVFFKINCPTCQLAMPFVQRIADGASPGTPRLIAISQNTRSETLEFLQHFGMRIPTLLDPAKDGYKASNGFRIDHVPTFFSIAPDGIVDRSFTGFVKSELEDLGARFGVATFRPDEKVPLMKPG